MLLLTWNNENSDDDLHHHQLDNVAHPTSVTHR